ncbi:palmdelphin-like isoform 2-T3 [Anableps anableps]
MEEHNVLRERLQTITEKNRIQEDILHKKLELEEEKLKLQHLKKRVLREQWLLQDSGIYSGHQQNVLSDMQQARALQLSIHRMEMEVDFLERQDSMISTNESLILNRLKIVEKSPEEIIKEAQHNFIEPLEVIINDFPECPSPSTNNLFQHNMPSNTLFNMEINVTENMLTGKSPAVASGNGSCEELNHHTSLKVYDEDSKCLHVLRSQQDSQAHKCVTELSASGVEQLLRSATTYSQPEHQCYLQDIRSYDEHSLYNHQDEKDTQGGHSINYVHRGSITKKDINYRENGQRPHDEHNCSTRSRTHWELSHHYSKHNSNYSLCQMRNCRSILQDRPTGPHSTIRFRSRINGSRSNHSLSNDQSETTACWTELCHVATRFIPAIDQDKLYCCYLSNSQPENSSNHCTALYSDLHCSRVPSPLCANDSPYTILHTAESSEPITAIFMGLHTAQDDSGQVQEFEGCLKAELVIIEEDHSEDSCMKEVKKCYQVPAESTTNRNQGVLYGVRERWSVRGAGPGFRNMKEKQKPCCTIC